MCAIATLWPSERGPAPGRTAGATQELDVRRGLPRIGENPGAQFGLRGVAAAVLYCTTRLTASSRPYSRSQGPHSGQVLTDLGSVQSARSPSRSA